MGIRVYSDCSNPCSFFSPFFFLSESGFFVPTYCRCKGLFLHHITLSDTFTHSGGLLWTGDRPFSETSTRQHTTLTRGKEADIHVPGRIRTCSPSKRAAAKQRLRTRDHRGPHCNVAVLCPVDNCWRCSETIFEVLSELFYFNTCTVHLLLFCTMTNKCTIVHLLVIVQNNNKKKTFSTVPTERLITAKDFIGIGVCCIVDGNWTTFPSILCL